MKTERVDPAGLRCASRFIDRFGRERPELDAFAWVPFHQIAKRCAKSMTAVLTRDVDLSVVLDQLIRHSRRE